MKATMKTCCAVLCLAMLAGSVSVQAHRGAIHGTFSGRLAIQELRAGTLVLSWGDPAGRRCFADPDPDASCRIDIVRRDGPVEDGSGASYRSFTISDRSGEQSFPAPAQTDTPQTLTATMRVIPSRARGYAIIHRHYTIPALPDTPEPPEPPTTPPEPPEPPNPPEPETPESVSCRTDYRTVYVPQLPRDAVLRIVNRGQAGTVNVTVHGAEAPPIGPYQLEANGIATDKLDLEAGPRWAAFTGSTGMKLTVLVRKHVDGVRMFFPTEREERCE